MTGNSGKIAVVIGAYNRRGMVESAILSGLEQKLPEGWSVTVVVVDDGSKDGTAQAVAQKFELQKRTEHCWSNQQLVLLIQENRERGAARNTGACYAMNELGADWLVFLDSDDRLASNSLYSFIERLRSLPDGTRPAALYANFTIWDGGEGLSAPNFPSVMPEGDLSSIIIRRHLFSLGGTFVASDAFRSVAGFTERRELSGSEDWDLWVRVAFSGPCYYSPHISYWYRRHGGNTPPGRFEASILGVRNKLVPFMRERLGENCEWAIEEVFLHANLAIAGTYNYYRCPRKALLFLIQAVLRRPRALMRFEFWRLVASWILGCAKLGFSRV